MGQVILSQWVVVLWVLGSICGIPAAYRLGQRYERQHTSHPREFYNWEEEGWHQSQQDRYWAEED